MLRLIGCLKSSFLNKINMNSSEEFNEKYKQYLEEGHYGMDLEGKELIEYIDKMFEVLILIPGFKYSQIKEKFSMGRFYHNLHEISSPQFAATITLAVEKKITDMVRIYDATYIYRKFLKELKKKANLTIEQIEEIDKLL